MRGDAQDDKCQQRTAEHRPVDRRASAGATTRSAGEPARKADGATAIVALNIFGREAITMRAVPLYSGIQRSPVGSAVLIAFALAVASGCGSGGSGGQSGSGGGAPATGGSASGGRTGVGGTGFGGSGAAGGSGPSGAAGNGGAVGSGGVGPGESGGTTGTGGAVGTGGLPGTGAGGASVGGSTGGQPGAGGQAGTSTGGQAGAAAVGNIDEFYEAEAVPPNQIFGFAQLAKGTPTCTKPLTAGASCFSAGGYVSWIVSKNGAHPSGWMQFNAISAPANASYDVTFWYHCGGNSTSGGVAYADVYGDCDCGGQMMTEPKQGGCRPHIFTVNGTVLPGAYHFPCFPGSWSTLYAATVSLPLTAGMNTIMVAAPDPRDASDVDVIEILPPGKGHAPLIATNTKDLLGQCK
jgi:hypothetical protein